MTKHTHTPADPSIVQGNGDELYPPDTATCAGCGKTIQARFGEPWRLAKTARAIALVQEHYNADSAEYEQIAIDRVLSIEASHDRINDAIEGVARAERELAHAVFAARNNGCTWDSIAGDLGVSRQTVWNRFGSSFDTPAD
jgi:hypothetical protein